MQYNISALGPQVHPDMELFRHSVLEVNYRRVIKGVYAIDLNDISFHGDNFASTDCNQVGSYGRMGGEDASQWIRLIALRVNLENRAFPGSVIPVKPIDHCYMRELIQPHEPEFVFLIQHNKSTLTFLHDLANRVKRICLDFVVVRPSGL